MPAPRSMRSWEQEPGNILWWMTVTKADLEQWLRGFAAVERADIESRRERGPDRARSIELSLSLLNVACAAAGGRYPFDVGRAASDAVARRAWRRLRSHRLE